MENYDYRLPLPVPQGEGLGVGSVISGDCYFNVVNIIF